MGSSGQVLKRLVETTDREIIFSLIKKKKKKNSLQDAVSEIVTTDYYS